MKYCIYLDHVKQSFWIICIRVGFRYVLSDTDTLPEILSDTDTDTLFKILSDTDTDTLLDILSDTDTLPDILSDTDTLLSDTDADTLPDILSDTNTDTLPDILSDTDTLWNILQIYLCFRPCGTELLWFQYLKLIYYLGIVQEMAWC